MLIVGIKDKQLSPQEREWIHAPQVGGVILFTRNFESREQASELIAEIRSVRAEPLLLCVDQEGGPVQRFRDGFTRLPALSRIGEVYARDRQRALDQALDRLRAKYGFGGLLRGASLALAADHQRTRDGFVLRTPSLNQ